MFCSYVCLKSNTALSFRLRDTLKHSPPVSLALVNLRIGLWVTARNECEGFNRVDCSHVARNWPLCRRV